MHSRLLYCFFLSVNPANEKNNCSKNNMKIQKHAEAMNM